MTLVPAQLIALLCLQILSISSSHGSTICFQRHDESGDRRNWAFETGVAFITSNNISEIVKGDVNVESGPAGGQIYSFTAARRLGEFDLEICGHHFRPQLELPLMLEIVNENARNPFWNLNASVVVRWVDFPWNHVVKTTIATGIGLSYSEKIYLIDIKRHPNSDRSNLKFNWPIQVTFALPAYPDHQLMLFIAHQSGGRIFDQGGVNSLGLGYRRDF